jgi:hypothetical protein
MVASKDLPLNSRDSRLYNFKTIIPSEAPEHRHIPASPGNRSKISDTFNAMTTIELLGGLQAYVALLATLRDLETQKNPGEQYSSTVSLSYNTLTLKLDVISESAQDRRSSLLYLQCTFRIAQQNVFFSEIYCQNNEREKELKDLIVHHTPAAGRAWNPVVQANIYKPEVVRYLAIADEIAKEGDSCSQGDNYSPGYFSEIIVADKEIELKQINHWNARSIDHKDDYHLRDLKFFIPLHSNEEKISRHDYAIGKMFIDLSNRSSRNNRHCGDKIREKIELEKLRYLL